METTNTEFLNNEQFNANFTGINETIKVDEDLLCNAIISMLYNQSLINESEYSLLKSKITSLSY